MPKMNPNPGPWSYECNLGSITIKDASGKAVAQARPRKDGWNAELLAAAPELLTAMMDIVQSSDANCGGSLANAIQAGRAAMFKAQGAMA